MPSKNSLLKIIEIQREIERMSYIPNSSYPFSRCFCMTLEKTLGYDKIIFGFLNNGQKRVDVGNVLYGVTSDFTRVWNSVYRSYVSLWKDSDSIVISRQDGEIAEAVAHTLLKPFKYTDFMLQFVPTLKSKKKYVSYFCIASDRVFSDEEIEIIQNIKPSIAAWEENYIEVWRLKNHLAMLLNYIEYFPLGVMLVEDINKVTFVNKLAKQYLYDLGVKHEDQYSTFFTTELYHYSKFDLLCNGPSFPIRIKDYLFNIIPISNPAKNLAKLQDILAGTDMMSPHPDLAMDKLDTTICIFIVNDNLYHTKFSFDSLSKIGLTKRESEIVELISSGMTDMQIANKLTISINTVRIHISNIFKKMGVKNRIQLIDTLNSQQKLM